MDLFRGDHPYFGGDPESDISVFAGIFAKNQENLRGKGMMCMPSGNHDMARISYQLDEEQMRLAYCHGSSKKNSGKIFYSTFCVSYRISSYVYYISLTQKVSYFILYNERF